MTPRVVVHGGLDCAGVPEVVRSLEEASRSAFHVLEKKGDAPKAVEVAVRVLEANPLFNAGVGSVLNEDGEVETDASIVDGTKGRFAGVAALANVKHPISVAARLLRRGASGPVLLVGEGAARFAAEVGEGEEDLRTSEQLSAWEETSRGASRRINPFTGRERGSDTVGAIAIDSRGHVAAGSSTGGTFFKMKGRVGDAALFGAGIYADDRIGVLCSGRGEAAIELSLAFRAAMYSEESDTETAAIRTIGLLEEKRAVGGVVLCDAARDRASVAHNASHLPVVSCGDDGFTLIQPVIVGAGSGG